MVQGNPKILLRYFLRERKLEIRVVNRKFKGWLGSGLWFVCQWFKYAADLIVSTD
jgi:hypothetical protein